MAKVLSAGRHGVFALVLQTALIVLFGVLVDYGPHAQPTVLSPDANNSRHHEAEEQTLHRYYPMFQDIHVMIFVGFGFLMTWLKRYSLSSLTFTFTLGSFLIQWAILCQGVFHLQDGKISVTIENLIAAEFAAATVLISFGVVLGVTTPLQLLVMAVLEVIIFSVNEWIGVELLKAVDIGGSMLIHIFGCYFGLMVSFMLPKGDVTQEKEAPNYSSDVSSLLGTIFLWLFWPSFNSVMAPGDDQHRAIINTFFSLAACCLTTFAVSTMLSSNNKVKMEHMQNATLAGGVAVGTAADMMLYPYGAMISGAAAGFICVFGIEYIQPWLHKRLKIHDTCGVHNLHGMPGILGGTVGAIMAGLASETEYGVSLYEQFPARLPSNATELLMLGLDPTLTGDGRSGALQAGYQMATLFVTMAIAIIGGLVTGAILRIPICGDIPSEYLYDDDMYLKVSPDRSYTAMNPAPSSDVEMTSKDDKCHQ